MTRNIILQITYGLEVQPAGDPFIDVAERAIEGSLVASIPGNFLVNSFPILKYVPEWFPGAGFHKKAREWKGYGLKMIESPFSATKRNMVRGIGTTLISYSYIVRNKRLQENLLIASFQ